MSGKPPHRPLGRGLAALLGEATSPISPPVPGAQQLPVDLLEPSPFQPRQEMDDTALQELADSITRQGVLQPLLVRPKPGAPSQYQIIAGERRWRAAQRARVHEVPVLVRPLSDSEAMAAGLVENLQRENLNPIEEAEGYRRLAGEFQLSHEQLAEAVGKSRSHISNMLRLTQLPAEVQALLRQGQLTAGHAKALLAHPDPVKAAAEVVRRGLSVRQTEALVQQAGRPTLASEAALRPAARSGDAGEIAALAAQLTEKLGLKVEVRYNGRGGALILHYTDLDQLDSLLALLNG
ncbi:ParB/RepB/Spo0J family partition protein [Acidocella sp.]|uniref:ParB/RepB/Spo0J family partition protein n=1 Tax=Acidocella sp. TaxID=50710 RepID=UPI00261B40AB|nr:ParB/RepB/Spo0J family partition protein [Acidocella sp.]